MVGFIPDDQYGPTPPAAQEAPWRWARAVDERYDDSAYERALDDDVWNVDPAGVLDAGLAFSLYDESGLGADVPIVNSTGNGVEETAYRIPGHFMLPNRPPSRWR